MIIKSWRLHLHQPHLASCFTYLQGSELSLYFPKTALIERTAQYFNIFFQIDAQKHTSSPRDNVLETDTVEKENYAKLLVTYKMAIHRFLLKLKYS